MSKVVRLLAELIAIPSVNPAFLPAAHPHAGEKQVAEFIANGASRAGLAVAWQRVLPQRSNVLVRLRPTGKIRQRILLAPHLDTVNVARETQFKPVRRHGRIYGRGACDTKGSVAVMLQALLDLAAAAQRPQTTEIIFVGLVDEESGQSGSRYLAAKKIRADLAIVGEPTRLAVATAHKGSVWLEVATRGRAAHGSTPWHGVNAIQTMAEVTQALANRYAAQLKKKSHRLLGSGTINIGTIHGGVQPNIVPDFCRVGVDRRTLPGESEAWTRQNLAAFLKAAGLAAKVGNVKLKLCPALETDPRDPLVRQFLRLNRQQQAVGLNYFCDAAVLAGGGIPSVVFGPGDIAQAHTADEWITVAQLEQGRAKLLRFLKSLP